MFLHWLLVSQRIDFKIFLVVYKSLNGLAPNQRSVAVVSTFHLQIFWFMSTLHLQNQNQTWKSSIQFLCSSNLDQTSRNLQKAEHFHNSNYLLKSSSREICLPTSTVQ
ncbi:hypothetical protein ILYODFUR_034620 [Ilyodon furcidens]|uniref:Uncharacterized protein n=1 Tax=Ilyodon furcidens TaxID=33524 RepID=A0ABV0SRK9_9TELE